jgi:hypothetical protein
MKTTQKVKWIDVRKELPEEGQRVFCIQNPNTTATREPLIGVYKDKRFHVPYLDEFHKFQPITNSRWSDIIFWMPLLPKTPKQLTDGKTGNS